MPTAFELFLWIVFATITFAGVGLALLLAWTAASAMVRGAKRASFYAIWPVPEPIVVPRFGSVSIRNQMTVVLTIWLTLLLLAPLLILALWAFATELQARRIGAGLAVAAVHLFLIWQLLRLGTRVQQRIELSRAGLTSHPVLGPTRELPWTAIVRVDDVRYVGPGVSGLYLHAVDGARVILDVWLPNWESLRGAIRELTPHAAWSSRRRGWLFG